MQQITGSKKFQNGIQVFWTDKGTDLNDFFLYEDLIDQKINAFDLLNNPRIYQMNAASHKIESLVAGCSFATKTCEDEIVITRFFDAPRELAWRAWTEPELVRQWWGPKNYTSPFRHDRPPGRRKIPLLYAISRRVATSGVPVCTVRLSDRSESSARTVLPMKRATWSRQPTTA